jgi:hypothetical protein
MWVAELPWVEAVVGCDGKLTMVRCKVYGKIEGHEKILVPKFDSLQKHASRCKCKVAWLGCVMRQYFMSIESQHAKNECLLASRG